MEVTIAGIGWGSSRAGIGFGPAQVGDAFDVLGLGEHVERGEAGEMIDAVGAQGLEIASQGGGMTGDVNHLVGRVWRRASMGEGGRATDPRRVGDDRGALGGEALEQCRHLFLGGADDEIAVRAPLLLLVEAGGADGEFVDFDAGEAFHFGAAFEREEAHATVGIDEEPRAALAQSGTDDVDEAGEEMKVILEERIGGTSQSFGEEAKVDLDAAFGRGLAADFEELLVEFGLLIGQ